MSGCLMSGHLMSGYAITAQFYDAMAGEPHAAVDARIAAALAGLETGGGPVIDIGAGTGLTTRVIARALPDAAILAIEPDPAMRPALMTRVWSDPDLRRRVSILPMPVLAAPLPPVIAAAVASASLVHFGPQDRRSLWALLSRHLAPGGRAVIEIQCPVAQDVPETRMATARLGQVDYEGWASAERLGDERLRWRMRYVARWNGTEIDRQSTEFLCWVVSAERLLAEAGDCGLAGCVADGLVVLRKAPPDGQGSLPGTGCP